MSNLGIGIEHDMRDRSSDCVGHRPCDGEEGSRLVASGPPSAVAKAAGSRTAGYLTQYIRGTDSSRR
jgi:excinuclease UvrABC ATPase subunit